MRQRPCRERDHHALGSVRRPAICYARTRGYKDAHYDEAKSCVKVYSASSPIDLSGLRVAIVHYWFVGRAGGEKVVEALAKIFPQADLFTLVADPVKLAPELRNHKLHTSFLQKIPGAIRFHRHFLFLQPIALEQFDLSGYDLVISSESGPAKGVITSPQTCHICYCHSPMRYIWDMYPQYVRTMNPVVKIVFSVVAHYLRQWDLASASRVDYFLANSNFVALRIRKFYCKKSTVIHPPVQMPVDPLQTIQEDHYLAVGRLVDYKRFDLAVLACTQLSRKLHVVGDGPQYKSLRRIAGPTIEFHGNLNDNELHKEFARCRALLFPGEEDFGMVPVEAQSFGKPVIAYGRGGSLETIRGLNSGDYAPEVPTGIFFSEQSVASLSAAILQFESNASRFDAHQIREHAQKFSVEVFQGRMKEFVMSAVQEFRSRAGAPKAFIQGKKQDTSFF
jgi:glycosyltransferase involved in cell wall biosynthesis